MREILGIAEERSEVIEWTLRIAVGVREAKQQVTLPRLLTALGIPLVGEVAAVDPAVLFPLLDAGYIPVISSVAADDEGQAHNINADTVAGELAAALQAEKLILLTDTAGILQDRHDPDSLIRQLTLADARQLIHDGVVAGGMTPKTECCIRALAQGVAAAHIVDGRVPHALLLEVFTDSGIGTMVVGSQRVGHG